MTEQFRKKALHVLGLVSLAVAVGLMGFMLTSSSADHHIESASQKTACNGICVFLKEKRAEPDTITAKTGEFVQFNSADGKAHSLSLGGGGEKHDHTGPFSSGEFKADEAWRVQFTEPGTYQFHDHYAPAINILVVVYNPS